MTGFGRSEIPPLHYQRRLVSGFYFYLLVAFESGVVDPKVIYMYWTRKDLEIIPEIIIPIERELVSRHGTGYAEEWFARLSRLHENAPAAGSRISA